ncbi:MAG: hypothetical protein K6D96_09365 [Acetatifactor sp.]|nr:hypothetical protein [Acetatifactor sp.]
MTEENRLLLKRINDFAETALGDIEDPQKVQVSIQLERLRPVFEEIAGEKNMSVEDVFILYMDLQSEATVASDNKIRESLRDLNEGSDGSPLLYR